MNGETKNNPIFLLITNEKIRSYVSGICKRNNFHPLIGVDLEDLIKKFKTRHNGIVIMDSEVVKSYGTRIYSRINVACPGCNLLLLCDQNRRDLIKEAVEYNVYACILPPYEEWEVLTMIRNIIAKEKFQGQKKLCKRQG